MGSAREAARRAPGCVAVLLLVALLLLPRPAAAQVPGAYGTRETWTSRDKAAHFGFSAVGAGLLYSAARRTGVERAPSAALAAVVVTALGVLREVHDASRSDKYFSEKDLLWNSAGIVVGIWIPDRFFFPR